MGTSKKASISKTRKPLRQLALRAAVNRHWREKRQCLSPAPISVHRKSAKSCSKSPGALSLSVFAPARAHKGSHAETGGISDGALSLPSTRTARSRTSPGRVSERQTLPFWGLGRGALPKNAESLRNSDALMRVAVPRRRGPAGLRDLFRFCRNCGLYALCSGPFRVCEARGGITTLSALYVLLKRRTTACQKGSFAVF